MAFGYVLGSAITFTGAYWLEKPQGGKGILLGGVPGVAPGRVVILGGGVVGTHAAMIALGMGADVTVDVGPERAGVKPGFGEDAHPTNLPATWTARPRAKSLT